MHNPIEEFEIELREIVFRSSKSDDCDGPIRELTAHFADIYEDEQLKSPDKERALARARDRMGSIESIAQQILIEPSREKKGRRIQLALSLFPLILSAVVCMAELSPYLRTDALLHFTRSVGYNLLIPFALGGVVFGYGIFLAKRFIWKPIAVSITSFMVLGSVYMAKLERNYPESLVRIVVTFSVIATLFFLFFALLAFCCLRAIKIVRKAQLRRGMLA